MLINNTLSMLFYLSLPMVIQGQPKLVICGEDRSMHFNYHFRLPHPFEASKYISRLVLVKKFFSFEMLRPLLILSMANDQRVPVTNSYNMFHALRDQGVETKFVLNPIGGHTPSDPAHVRDVRIRIIYWFKNHLGE